MLPLAACKKSEPAEAAVDAGKATTAGEPNGLPGGATLPFKHHIRVDRVIENKAGAKRRRVDVEFLDGDVAATVKGVESAMVAAGYRLRADDPRDVDGEVRLRFIKKGEPTVMAVISPNPGRNPSSSKVKGTVVLSNAVR